MFFVYNHGEKVRVKSKGKSGVVKTRKFEDYLKDGKTVEGIRYYVQYQGYYSEWADESDLESIDNPTFSKKFEEGLTNLMIDANLIVGNYDQVKALSDQKKRK